MAGTLHVKETLRVAPMTNQNQHSSFPLTFFDLYWLDFRPTKRLYFFPFPDLTATSFHHAILPDLSLSLSSTLSAFLPLAATLSRPPHSPEPLLLLLPGSSVSLTVAHSTADFSALSDKAIRPSSHSHPLLSDLPSSPATTHSPVLALRATLFVGAGFTIGITSHHGVVDGRSLTMFLKAWAFFCRGGGRERLPPHLTPAPQRDLILDPRGIKQVFLAKAAETHTPTLPSTTKSMSSHGRSRGTFVFSGTDVIKLRRNMALWEQGRRRSQDAATGASRFALACGFVWACLAAARGAAHERVYFLFAADARSRLDPPVPMGYFGNCVVSLVAEAEEVALAGEGGEVVGATAIRKAVRGLEEGGVSLDPKDRLPKMPGLVGKRVLTVAGSVQFAEYDLDFGWGTPCKAEIVSIDESGAIGIFGIGDDGVEIELALEDKDMHLFAKEFVRRLDVARDVGQINGNILVSQ